MLSLLCILYLLSPSLVPCPGCVCACVCACLCVCNLVFSSDSHLSAHRSSGSRPASTCQLLCSSVLPHRARGSVSLCLSATVPVRLPTFCPFTCLLARRFVCSWSVSLCRSSFSVSVFHRLSEFLSFCKLLCLFLDSANTVSCVYACVRVTVCVCALSYCSRSCIQLSVRARSP